MKEGTGLGFLKELRRRRVFRVAGLYVVGVWLLMQVADIVFPAWGIPDAAIRVLLWAALLGFPVALAFGWVFQITPEGIRRTPSEWSESELQAAMPLRPTDYLILSAFVVAIGWIGYEAVGRVVQTTGEEEWRPSAAKIVENSVAVLPFASLSGDPEHEYFADGISEEILNRLSAFGELKVIARTSSFAFKNSGYDIARISGLLGVKYLLQGSVRRDGQQLRIAAQLVDQSGVQVWSDSFDRQLGAIFALQEEIAESVATSIMPRIVPPSADERLPDLKAYEAYLTGREILARRERNSGGRALAYFDRAIELDPEFAELYAERAVAELMQIGRDDESDLWLDRAQRDIDRALQLKPDLARAHAAQGLLMTIRDPFGSWTDREAVLRKSLALDPNQVDAWNWLHSALVGQGREDEAEQALERALRLDPLAPAINANMAVMEAARGDHAEAEQRLLRVLEAPWAPVPVFAALIFEYLGSGRLVEAIDMAKRFVLATLSSTGRPPELFGLIGIYATLGRHEQAEYWRDRNRELYPDNTMMRMTELYILSLHGGALAYPEALTQLQGIVESTGLDLDRAPAGFAGTYGELLALSGDHESAIRVLEPLADPAQGTFDGQNRAVQTLAWAYLHIGDRDKAAVLLEPLAREYREAHAAGRLRRFTPGGGYTDGLAGYAMTTLLSGDRETALDLLDEAVKTGWRGFYGVRRDPRWDAVREHPRFQAIMAKVRADIDLQRARVEAIEAEDDFAARFDAQLALHAGKADEEAR